MVEIFLILLFLFSVVLFGYIGYVIGRHDVEVSYWRGYDDGNRHLRASNKTIDETFEKVDTYV